ncbi:MAG TPA: NAD-dependent deacylase, partial [Bacteroidales bacterium]|nr:NAD-dependent deacylase [Bacteroidales bacterium]
MKKKLVVLTGAGISAESGLKTFRDMDGLWEQYDVMEVASIEGWFRNPQLILKFYNERRKQLETALPNAGHKGLVDLEKYFDVYIITQNVDNLHERAGSKNIVHLHGELTKVRSTTYEDDIQDIGYREIQWGDKCKRGAQLRPHIVWFGEAVPAIEEAAEITATADVFAVIGTSLNVYPAAGLISYVPKNAPVFLVDPNEVTVSLPGRVDFIKEKAGKGVEILKKKLLSYFKLEE